ncbi:glycosyltransferase [Streptomyces cucumeris]|uniref:glycosyltransferase n=1 Tax=Streptomyces cucumeris TaxID=2962890 RepID=UPI003D7150D8
MIDQHPTLRRSILFVRASWRLDAVTGTDRALTTLAAALATAGHRVVIATATDQCEGTGLPGVIVEQLDLPITPPCTPQELRESLIIGEAKIQRALDTLVRHHQCDTVAFVDALWGLGRVRADLPDGVQRVLLISRLPHEQDMPPALAYADSIIASSHFVLRHAANAAWPTRRWRVVPEAFLQSHDRHNSTAQHPSTRHPDGPVRVLVPADQNVGALELIAAARAWHRTVEVALAPAGPYGPQTLHQKCHQIARLAPNITLVPPPGWAEVSDWLAQATAVIMPCRWPTSALTAIEALNRGTPVIAYRTSVLADLLHPIQNGPRPLLAEVMHGPSALLFLTDGLLADPGVYQATCQAASNRAQDFHPHRAVELFCSILS